VLRYGYISVFSAPWSFRC